MNHKPLNKVIYHKGDVIEAALSGEYDIFIHGCNCVNIMGGGVALQVRNRITALYKADQNFRIAYEDRLGLCSSVKVKGTWMFNLYTQMVPDTTSRQLNYGALVSSLICSIEKQFIDEVLLDHTKPIKVCLPRIGCGLAGGDWVIVEEILAYLDLDWNIEFHVYDFEA